MRAQIDVLKQVFCEWLQMHDLDYDIWFYTPAEWAEKEGDDHYLKGAELMVVFENGLYQHFNYPGEYDVEHELQDLAAGFGYWFEFGHHWNLGFYAIEDWPDVPQVGTPYAELLKDSRWQDKRKRILERCQNECEECGATNKPLDVHHCYYRYGRSQWQYPDGAFLALCRECHEARADVELRFRLFAPTMKTGDLALLQRVVRHCQYWFDRDHFREFLEALESAPGGISIGGKDGEALTAEEYEQRYKSAMYRILHENLAQMLNSHGDPDERGDNWPRNWL